MAAQTLPPPLAAALPLRRWSHSGSSMSMLVTSAQSATLHHAPAAPPAHSPAPPLRSAGTDARYAATLARPPSSVLLGNILSLEGYQHLHDAAASHGLPTSSSSSGCSTGASEQVL